MTNNARYEDRTLSTPQAKKTASVKRFALAEQTYEAIKEQVLDQVIVPGARVNIDKLVAELGVSTSPIREALSRLNAEGLLQFEPYVGYSAAPIPDDAWFRDMIDFRIMFEGKCAEVGAALRSDDVLTEMENDLNAMSAAGLGQHYQKYQRFTDADAAFHRAIVASSSNQVNIQVYGNLRPHMHHARLYLDRGAERQATTERQHRAIFEAFVARDGRQARRAIEEHLESTRSYLMKTM